MDSEIDQQAISDFAWFILGACLVCQWHFIVSTVKQMAASLGIHIFTVRDKVSSNFIWASLFEDRILRLTEV